MSKLDDAKRALYAEVARSMADGGGAPLEDDAELNDASRRVIAAMKAEHGRAVLGFISPGEDEGDDEFSFFDHDDHDGEEVPDFGADFVLPGEDRELESMILENFAADERDPALVGRILERIEAAGGVALVWG